MNTKFKSRILEAVHDTASSLHETGCISGERMKEYDALCVEPVPAYGSEEIRNLRRRLEISQQALATVLNTSLSTVQKWEIGAKSREARPASCCTCWTGKDLKFCFKLYIPMADRTESI